MIYIARKKEVIKKPARPVFFNHYQMINQSKIIAL